MSNSWARSQARLVYAEAFQAAHETSDFQIQKIPRSANGAAHYLAAYRVLSSGVMHFCAPACVLKQVRLDCNTDYPP
jgi:hypothetical protein